MLITRTFLALQSLQSDRKGVTAVEYGLIAGLIAVAIIVAITAVGSNLKTLFNTIANNVSSASS